MLDITDKSNSLHSAVAQAIVRVSKAETIEAIQNDQVRGGNVFEVSRAVGLLGIKKTPEILPDSHPLPIDHASIDFEIKGLDIHVVCSIKTIYKTGVQLEAMHGASVVALYLYDRLKSLDGNIDIHEIRLLEKHGGKSSFRDRFREEINAAVINCSDVISAGQKDDVAGQAISDKLVEMEINVSDYLVIPADADVIREKAKHFIEQGTDIILFTGGTGLSGRDVTPEALLPLIDRRLPGIEEAMRDFGQNRTPYAMFSRSLAGTAGKSLILALPGSANGARQSMDAIFPAVIHLFGIFKGYRRQKESKE